MNPEARPPVMTESFLCRLKKDDKEYLEFVTIRIFLSKRKEVMRNKNPEDTYFFSFRSKAGLISRTLTGGKGPYDSIMVALNVGMNKLLPFMDSQAMLEYSFDSGVLEVNLVKTDIGYRATVSIGDRTVFWTDPEIDVSLTIFAAEEYIYSNYREVTRMTDDKN